MNICTYNTRFISHKGDLERLIEPLETVVCVSVGLCEAKRKGEGTTEMPYGIWIYDTEKQRKTQSLKGLAFLKNKSMGDSMVGFTTYSDRVISCKLTHSLTEVFDPA